MFGFLGFYMTDFDKFYLNLCCFIVFATALPNYLPINAVLALKIDGIKKVHNEIEAKIIDVVFYFFIEKFPLNFHENPEQATTLRANTLGVVRYREGD